MLLSFLSTLVYTLTFVTLYLTTTAQSFSPDFSYATQKVRGVNLGGWLVLEVRLFSKSIRFSSTHKLQSYITPSLFQNTGNPQIIDEWTFGLLQNRAVATAALTNHWNTWITEADFAAIAAAG
jgi:glucan 1,3-beta-glucosidase